MGYKLEAFQKQCSFESLTPLLVQISTLTMIWLQQLLRLICRFLGEPFHS